jgi:hypothetical protein
MRSLIPTGVAKAVGDTGGGALGKAGGYGGVADFGGLWVETGAVAIALCRSITINRNGKSQKLAFLDLAVWSVNCKI